MQRARQQVDDAAREAAGVVGATPERQAKALEHASHLHQQWNQHQRYMILLQDRFQEAQEELRVLKSVHPQGQVGPEEVEQIVERLYPHPEVTHKYDPEAREQEKKARSKAKARAKRMFLKKNHVKIVDLSNHATQDASKSSTDPLDVTMKLPRGASAARGTSTQEVASLEAPDEASLTPAPKPTTLVRVRSAMQFNRLLGEGVAQALTPTTGSAAEVATS